MSTYYGIENSIYATTSLNVGIGITNPTKKLEVVGDIDTTTDYNINGVQVLSATTLGSAVVNSSLTSNTGNLTNTGDFTTTGDLYIANTKNIRINSVAVLDATTLGSGVINSSLTSNTGNLTNTGDFTTTGDLYVANTKNIRINSVAVLDATTLGSGVVNSSLTSVGTLSSLSVTGNLTVDTNVLFVDANSNLVNMNGELDVWGKFRADSTAIYAENGIVSLSNNLSGPVIDSSNTQNIRLTPNLNYVGALVVDSTGKVGIGTQSPSSLLDVATSSTTEPALLIRNGNAGASFNDGAQIEFGYQNTSDYAHYIHTRHNTSASGNAIDFYVSDGTALNSVTSGSTHTMSLVDGNVGIGITDPSNKLDVAGDINLTGDLRINGTIQTFGAVWSSNGASRYYNGGNVGIGTSDPAHPLHVYADSTMSAFIDSRGNIFSGRTTGYSVGTAALHIHTHITNVPTYTTLIQSTFNDATLKVESTNGSGRDAYLQLKGSGGSSRQWDFESNSGGKLYINDATNSNATSMTFLTGGNVGIGTNAPDVKLHVNGKISSDHRVAHFRDEKSNYTSGGTFTSGAWRTRDLNTFSGDTSFATLNANQITFTENGVYRIRARAPCYAGQRHKCKLYNVSANADIIMGSSEMMNSATQSDSSIDTIQTITLKPTIELQHYCQLTQPTHGFGVGSNFSAIEVYAEIWIEKLS